MPPQSWGRIKKTQRGVCPSARPDVEESRRLNVVVHAEKPPRRRNECQFPDLTSDAIKKEVIDRPPCTSACPLDDCVRATAQKNEIQGTVGDEPVLNENPCDDFVSS